MKDEDIEGMNTYYFNKFGGEGSGLVSLEDSTALSDAGFLLGEFAPFCKLRGERKKVAVYGRVI